LSRPCRHHGKHILTGKDGVDHLLLPRTETGIAEVGFEDRMGIFPALCNITPPYRFFASVS
ncbi:MAG: hypothetical protein LBG22_10310, partial [Treponema sp.]|nr:hypothetical protein [Treponema sp.]